MSPGIPLALAFRTQVLRGPLGRLLRFACACRGVSVLLTSADEHDEVDTTMPDEIGKPISVVTMLLRFDSPFKQGLFDYCEALAAYPLPETNQWSPARPEG